MASPERQDLIRNAVAFLADPKATSSLAQRMQFLEAKGLSGPEIDEAMRHSTIPSAYPPGYGPSPYVAQPPTGQWDWRDYFITAVVSGTVAFGAVSLFQKYVMPHLQPPSSTAYEVDRDALAAQFDAAEAALKEIQAETTAVRLAVEEQNGRVEKATQDVQDVVKQMKEGETKTRDEMREIREEVNNVRDMLPKMIEKNKESHVQSMAELQQELNRGPSMPSINGMATPILSSKPTIPAWQLAGPTHSNTQSSVSLPSSPGSVPGPPMVPNGKGKEVDLMSTNTTPTSSRTSPAPIPVTDHPLSPTFATFSPQPASQTPIPQTSGSQIPVFQTSAFQIFDVEASPSPTDHTETSPFKTDQIATVLSPTSSPLPESPTLSPKLEAPCSPALDLSQESLLGASSPSEKSISSLAVSVAAEQAPHSESTLSTPVLGENASVSQGTANGSAIVSADDGQNTEDTDVVEGTEASQYLKAIEHEAIPAPANPPRILLSNDFQVRYCVLRSGFLDLSGSDVSTSFKRLQAEKLAADKVVQEFTPLETVQEVDALRDYLQNMNLKTEMAQDEIRRLTGKLTRQDERIEELRDIHRLESKSRSDQIDKLRAQVDEAEALLKAPKARLLILERAKSSAKEEEEKRTKAVTLLKTVRQKLVKAEKDRDELQKEDIAVAGLRAQFDKEIAALKDKHEKEIAMLRGQFELEAITTKREIDNLELSVQAELESSRSHLESLEGQSTELQYQLREANDRIALLNEDSQMPNENRSLCTRYRTVRRGGYRMLSAAEAKYESRRERDEGEAEWSRKLSEKVGELETLRGTLTSSVKSREESSELEEARSHQRRIADLRAQAEKVTEIESAAQTQLSELSAKAAALQQHVEDGKSREAQLRVHNKVELREELRKVQSSAALLERQRNPGVGYWASRQDNNSPEARSPRSSVSDLPRDTPSRPGTPSTVKSEEEVNFEYLRNVILQFLEHKEMRPHLVRILSTILRFTPQETRRLVSKV
ncbi:hypothetical protein B0H21DRAFT_868888 [Amylocystis lapponica]|nr:hypothetical protein B0H21DRAFT_868888 [Amylocystis lapponica]